MPYIQGTATDHDDLIAQLCTWVSDAEIHGADAWEVMQQEPWPKGTIIKAHGWGEGEHFYIGFMPKKVIQGTTYKEWLTQKDVMLREFVWSRNGLRISPTTSPIFISGTTVTVGEGESSSSYSLSEPEIFQRSAWPLFLGAFKQYSPGLDWQEQAGASSIAPKGFPLFYTTREPGLKKFTPPLFPGVGFPAIAMNIDGPMSGVFKFWATKDRHRIVLVTNDSGFWNVAHLGFLEPYHKPHEYACPLCVIGGTSGAKTMGQSIFMNPGDAYPTPTLGFRFDYSVKNADLSSGLPVSAAAPANTSSTWTDENYLSQVQLMLPDGTWSSFFNWLNKEETLTDACGSSISYSYANKEPELNTEAKNYVLPTNGNVGKLQHIYTTASEDPIYSLSPLELAHGTSEATMRADVLGSVWGIYWPSSKVLRYGEVTFEEKKFLVVPNLYEGRRWYYPHGKTDITSIDALVEQHNVISEITNGISACIIRLED